MRTLASSNGVKTDAIPLLPIRKSTEAGWPAEGMAAASEKVTVRVV
jgi:hypothetical protein